MTAAFRPDLTAREEIIAGLLERGASTDHIARELCIARQTVRNHINSIMSKMGVHSRLEVVAIRRAERACSGCGLTPALIELVRT